MRTVILVVGILIATAIYPNFWEIRIHPFNPGIIVLVGMLAYITDIIELINKLKHDNNRK